MFSNMVAIFFFPYKENDDYYMLIVLKSRIFTLNTGFEDFVCYLFYNNSISNHKKISRIIVLTS